MSTVEPTAQLCELTEVEAASTTATLDAAITDGEVDEIVQVHSKAVQERDETTTAPSTSEEDNYDSDDDEDGDSKSNHSNSNRGSKHNKSTGDVKRSHHNVLERKRRDLIKDSFAQLKQVVPTISKDRASRAQILKEAAEFIQRSLQRNETIKSQLSDYMRKNKELEQRYGKNSPDAASDDLPKPAKNHSEVKDEPDISG